MSDYNKIQLFINRAVKRHEKQIEYLRELFNNKKIYEVAEKISNTYSKLLEKR